MGITEKLEKRQLLQLELKALKQQQADVEAAIAKKINEIKDIEQSIAN